MKGMSIEGETRELIMFTRGQHWSTAQIMNFLEDAKEYVLFICHIILMKQRANL